ncbi:MAG: methyltransferase domain-containing protein [Candidatus Aegiribacteria sp.]|nr:methyltransferase domain-containing protein [Candidatus Aegiribacteria sp.]
MKCIICNSDSSYYFSKTYSESPFDVFMQEIGKVSYYKCDNCGFVLSKTHRELANSKWNDLNNLFHHHIENPNNEKKGNQPPYAEQAMMLSILGKNAIISIDSIVDYAAGYGTLSNILSKYFSIVLPIFDPYVNREGEEYSDRCIIDISHQSYGTVINSAMFEHVLTREDLDHVNSLVGDNGCLIIHTVICERVPNDPNWFYLRPPVHTAFHTNKSMQLLMDQWGYYSSIYCPQSKCWVLFKNKIRNIDKLLNSVNQELQTDWFLYKEGFLDYWKGF